MNRAIGTAAAVAVVVAALALPVLGAFGQPGAPMEEGKLLTAAGLVLDGDVPHRDFEHFYGPGDVWAVAAAFATLGHSVDAERALGVVYLAVLVGSVFVLALRAGRVPAAAAAIVAGWLLVPFGVHAYSWTAGLALLLAATAVVVSADRPSAVGTAVAGALAGLALLFRADMVIAVALVAAIVWPALDRRQRLAGLAGGAIGGGLPYVVHLVTAGWSSTWRGMVTDSVFRLRDGRALPVPPPGNDLTAWLDLSAPEPTRSAVLPDPERVTQLRAFFWLTALAIVCLAVVGVVALVRKHAHARWFACLGAIAVAIAPQMLQRADATHVRFVACVVVPLAPVAFALAWKALDAKLPTAAVATQAIAMTTAVVVLAVPYYAARLPATTVGRAVGNVRTQEVSIDGRSFPVIDPLAPDATALLETIDERVPMRDGGSGRARATLFVGPQDLRLANYSDAFLYFVLGERFRPVSFYLESNPGIANADDATLADDLRRADVVVLSREYDNWDEPNTSRKRGPSAPLDVVEREFCVAAEVGRYRLLLRDCQ